VERCGALLSVQLLKPLRGIGGLCRDEHPFAEHYERFRTLRQSSAFAGSASVSREQDRGRAEQVFCGPTGIGLANGRLAVVVQFALPLRRVTGRRALAPPG
jgi:hypothetical protein